MTQMHEVEEKLFQLQGKLFQLTENTLVALSQALELGDVHGNSKLFMVKTSIFILRNFLKSLWKTLIKF